MERLAGLVRARRRRARCRGARSRGREPRDRARPGLRPGPIRPARFSLAGHAKGASAKRSRRRLFPLISPRGTRATRLRLGVVPARLCQNAAAASRSRYPRTSARPVGAGLVACGGNAAIGSSGGRNISEHIGIPYKGGIRSGRRGLGRGVPLGCHAATHPPAHVRMRELFVVMAPNRAAAATILEARLREQPVVCMRRSIASSICEVICIPTTLFHVQDY